MSAAELQALAAQVLACPLTSGNKEWFTLNCPASRGQALPIPGINGVKVVANQSCTMRPGAGLGVQFIVGKSGQGQSGKSVYVAGLTKTTPPQDIRNALNLGLLALAASPQLFMYTQPV